MTIDSRKIGQLQSRLIRSAIYVYDAHFDKSPVHTTGPGEQSSTHVASVGQECGREHQLGVERLIDVEIGIDADGEEEDDEAQEVDLQEKADMMR